MAERCFDCKSAFKEAGKRFYCCERRESVCEKCAKMGCKKCSKKRDKIVHVQKCSFKTCKKLYDVDDMFFDFKGNYYLCPKCLGRDFRY